MLSLAALIMVSCGMGGGAKAVDLTDKESIESVAGQIGEHVDPQAKIVSVIFLRTGRDTTRMDIIAMELYEPGNDKLRTYTFNLGGFAAPDKRDALVTTNKAAASQGVTLEELNLPSVSDYLAEGVSIIEDERNCMFTGVDSYMIMVDRSSGELKHTFKLKNKIDPEKKAAGAVVKYSYPILDFDVTDGKVRRLHS